MSEPITPKQARALVTDTGWRMVKQGKIVPSRCGRWDVYQVDTDRSMYARRPAPKGYASGLTLVRAA